LLSRLLGRLLFKHYFPTERAPQTFTRFIGSTEQKGLPSEYSDVLTAHWTRWGGPLNGYRNAVIHDHPINENSTTCWFEPKGQQWTLTVRLPADVKVKRGRFDFENGPDALAYCHSHLCALTALAERTCALTAVRRGLDGTA
jgi:hypothetical protein